MLGAALHEVDLCSAQAVQASVDEYMKTFLNARSDNFSRKLGLVAWDMELLVAFQQLMYQDKGERAKNLEGHACRPRSAYTLKSSSLSHAAFQLFSFSHAA